MGIQQNTDAVIQAYHICRDTVQRLEQEHGPSIHMRESDGGYVWTFEDRVSVKLDKNGNIS